MHAVPRPINICISGLTAAGKTTHSHLLAGEFGLTYVSASQILLSIAGLSPIQTRDFWLSDEAQKLWTDDMTLKVDKELRRLSRLGQNIVFDSFAMPWRNVGPCLRVFLRSSSHSRTLKAIVSHRGDGKVPLNRYEGALRRKDDALLDSHQRLFGIELDRDVKECELVLDISGEIAAPTFEASRQSIRSVHQCLRSAVAYALTGDPKEREEYCAIKARRSHLFELDGLVP